MANNVYDIYIHHDTVGDGGQNDASGAINASPSNPSTSAKKTAKEAASGSSLSKVAAVYLGKQAFQYATSNYGDLTGDQLGQAWISEGIEIGGYIGMTIANPTLGILAFATSTAKRFIDYEIEKRKTEQAAIVLNERIGKTISSGGRR